MSIISIIKANKGNSTVKARIQNKSLPQNDFLKYKSEAEEIAKTMDYSTIEEYRDKYNKLKPELKQFFKPPEEIEKTPEYIAYQTQAEALNQERQAYNLAVDWIAKRKPPYALEGRAKQIYYELTNRQYKNKYEKEYEKAKQDYDAYITKVGTEWKQTGGMLIFNKEPLYMLTSGLL